jgi:hypothetical protein
MDLRAWDISKPAESEPVVTLSYDAGRFTGTGGCNRYFAVVEGGAMAGEVKVGPLAGTRMACPEPRSSVEARFLEQLGGARTFASCSAGWRSRTRGAMVPAARCCSMRALHPESGDRARGPSSFGKRLPACSSTGFTTYCDDTREGAGGRWREHTPAPATPP